VKNAATGRWRCGWVFVWLILCGCGPSKEDQRQIQGLHSAKVLERLKAISEAENRHADTAVRSALLGIFENEREVPIVRASAGIALAHLHDPRVVSTAIKRLPEAILALSQAGPKRNLDPFLLGKALAAYGPESLEPLSALLKDPHREVVAWTVMHHGLYRHNDRALAVLSHYLDDRDTDLRRAASFGLSLTAHPRAEEVALRHLGDPDLEVRYNLVWALGNFGTSQSAKPLGALLAKEADARLKTEIGKAMAAAKSRPVVAPAAAPPVSKK
jgi:HEAT repeat protein